MKAAPPENPAQDFHASRCGARCPDWPLVGWASAAWRSLALLISGSVLVALASPSASASRIIDVNATQFSVLLITLPAYTSLTVQSTSCTAGADPFFHLLNGTPASFGSFGSQIAFDDNSAGGVNARIILPAHHLVRQLALIVRATSNTTSGTCAIQVNGAPWVQSAPVGGRFVSGAGLTRSSNDQIRTQLLPGGSVMPSVIGFGPNNSTIAWTAIGNAIAGASSWVTTTTESWFLVGTPRVASMQTWQLPPRAGPTRLMSNDIETDSSDGDGLGDLLEAALGTCPVNPCANTATAKDTDRDGLTDFEEVFGIAGILPNGSDDIALSRWGATPRQKDAFVEVDHIADLGAPYAFGQNPFEWMRQNGVSVENWVNQVLGVFVPQTMQNHLKNPAGHLAAPNTLSLRVHLDLGEAPLNPQDEWRFGDYGGASKRSLEREVWIRVKGPVDGFTIQVNGGSPAVGDATGLSTGLAALVIGSAALSTGQPIQVALIYDSGAWVVAIRPTTVGIPLQVNLSFGGASGATIESEGLGSIRGHYNNDATQVDAVRRGRFRYGVIHLTGQAGGARFTSNLDTRTFAHEFGHTIGMQHYGHDTWGATDIECIPHYLSIMRYGNDAFMRLNELDNVTFNPAQATEVQPFGAINPSIAPGNYSFMVAPPWNYPSPPGSNPATSVDLNRDGAIALATETWRTMSLTLNWDCKSLSQGAQVLVSTTAVSGAVDLVRFSGRLYAFWATGGAIQYRSALLGTSDAKSCTGPSSPYDVGQCLTWGATKTLADTNSARGVTAQAFGPLLFVAYNDAASNLVIRRYALSGTDSWLLIGTSPFGVDANERTNRTPELFIAHNQGSGTLAVAYLAQSGQFRQRTWNGTSWSTMNLTTGPENHNNLTPVWLTGTQAPVMKTWPDPTTPGVPEAGDSTRRTYALFPNDQGQLRLYVLTTAPNTWDVVRGFNEVTGAKPFLEFRYLRTGTGSLRTHMNVPTMGGHFVLGYHDPDGAGITRARFLVSEYVDANNPVAPPWPSTGWRMGLAPIRDTVGNVWSVDLPSTSMSLYTDRSLDNVFGLVARGDAVRFLPHADGSPNHAYRVRSDYRTMEDYVCWELKSSLGAGQGDFHCGGVNVSD